MANSMRQNSVVSGAFNLCVNCCLVLGQLINQQLHQYVFKLGFDVIFSQQNTICLPITNAQLCMPNILHLISF
jgi:hypothetical protein